MNQTNNEIKPIYLQDLLSVARELPKIPNIDHEKLILDSYREGSWKAVDKYIDFALSLAKELNIEPKPNKSLQDKIRDFLILCTYGTIKSLTGAYLWLQRNLWISIKPVDKCIFSRRVEARGKIIYGYSVLITFNGKQYPTKK